MSSAPLRVAVWSTGGIGSTAVRALHRRPDMELAGVWVHSPDKDGRDAGELIGDGTYGVVTTSDADSLIAERPDCVVYAASGPERDAAAVPDYCRMLAAGINVVATTTTRLVYPPVYTETWRDELSQAAKAGGASLYVSGIFPGFASDQLALVMSTQSNTIRRIRAFDGCGRRTTSRRRSRARCARARAARGRTGRSRAAGAGRSRRGRRTWVTR